MSTDTSRTDPQYVFISLTRHRNLVLQMVRREILGRYRGSVMGLMWSFFNPILMLTIYTLVFGVVFKSRWGQGPIESKAEFAIVLFAGLIVHSLFAECINRAPTLILSNPNYVKKVVFPLEILPWTSLGGALFHAAISLFVLLAAIFAVHHSVHWTVLALPLIWLPYLLLIMGLSWFLASTGVYLRDVVQTTSLITTVLLFLSPVFYPATALPEPYRPLLHLNPLTFVIEHTRGVLLWGELPQWQSLGLYYVASMLIAYAGLFWFQKTRKGFADVL
jgi:lipopolysaccharide transport system permease protein